MVVKNSLYANDSIICFLLQFCGILLLNRISHCPMNLLVHESVRQAENLQSYIQLVQWYVFAINQTYLVIVEHDVL